MLVIMMMLVVLVVVEVVCLCLRQPPPATLRVPQAGWLPKSQPEVVRQCMVRMRIVINNPHFFTKENLNRISDLMTDI